MKISKSRLKQIIKEELESVISEEEDDLEENLHEEEGNESADELRREIEKLMKRLKKITKTPPVKDNPPEKKEVPVKRRKNEGVDEDDEDMVNEEVSCEKLRTGGRAFRRAMKTLCDHWTTLNDQMPDVAGPKPKYCDCPEMQ